ncbi:MAG: CPBP family intramembrane glutamic endopeptidase [Candidatus Thorarchaeota archaeon]
MSKFIEQNSLGLFFLLAIPLGWFWWIQMYLGLWSIELIIIPSSLGGLSPLLTLWLLDKFRGDSKILGPIFQSIHTWKERIPWLIVAAIAYPLLIVVGNLISFFAGTESQLTILRPGPDELGIALIAIIPITFFAGNISSPLFEEPGWRGFALPQLQARFGRELGSLMIGCYWWLWHQMMNISFGIYPSITGFVSMLGLSFAIDSIFNLSNRNLLAAMFAHSSSFIVNTYFFLSTNDLTTLTLSLVVWIFVIGLRLIEKKRGYPSTIEKE